MLNHLLMIEEGVNTDRNVAMLDDDEPGDAKECRELQPT